MSWKRLFNNKEFRCISIRLFKKEAESVRADLKKKYKNVRMTKEGKGYALWVRDCLGSG